MIDSLRSVQADLANQSAAVLQEIDALHPVANFSCVSLLTQMTADLTYIKKNVRRINNKISEHGRRIKNMEQSLRNWTPREGIVTPTGDQILAKFPATTEAELLTFQSSVKEKVFELQILVG